MFKVLPMRIPYCIKKPYTSLIVNMSDEQQYIRITKGEIGPDGELHEIITMMQTIDNRRNHRDIRSNIQNSSEYQTLKYPGHNYQLSEAQMQKFRQAYATKDRVPNPGFLGWDTSDSSLISNRYYTWTPTQRKIGKHYYFTATPNR